jgi:hypothetical protein
MLAVSMESRNVTGKKEDVKGGGVCIYCGWDGGQDGLRDEHTIPYSLGGDTELKNASCSRCEAVTSYLDGYLARAVFGHFRARMGFQSRSGHPDLFPVTVDVDGEIRELSLGREDAPYFLNLPALPLPGILKFKRLTDDYGQVQTYAYWKIPPSFREKLDLKDNQIVKVINNRPKTNLYTFARALAKIGYCNHVLQFGLDGFRPLAIPDLILGKFPHAAFFVGAASGLPPPPDTSPTHSIGLHQVRHGRFKLLASTIRLFATDGDPAHGMPIYWVICGSEGRRKVVPKQPLPKLPRSIAL